MDEQCLLLVLESQAVLRVISERGRSRRHEEHHHKRKVRSKMTHEYHGAAILTKRVKSGQFWLGLTRIETQMLTSCR